MFFSFSSWPGRFLLKPFFWLLTEPWKTKWRLRYIYLYYTTHTYLHGEIGEQETLPHRERAPRVPNLL